MPDFDFETLFFMNYDVCMSPSFKSLAMKHLASMLCLTNLGIFQVLFVCLIILQQVVLVRVSGHVFN